MRPSLRPLVAVATAFLVGSCIGPQGGHRDGYTQEGPPTVTGPIERTTSHVRGTVLNAVTNAPVAGARVEMAEVTAISGSDGSYTLSNLLVAAGTIVTSAPGFDTTRTQLALQGGEVLWNPRLVPSASQDR